MSTSDRILAAVCDTNASNIDRFKHAAMVTEMVIGAVKGRPLDRALLEAVKEVPTPKAAA